MTKKEAVKILLDSDRIWEYGNPPRKERQAITMAIAALEDSAEPRWVPTAERLPEEDGHYIVTFKNGWLPNNIIPIDILLYAEGKWKYYFEFDNDGFEDDDFEDPITAWMPLPEPYQSEEGQE